MEEKIIVILLFVVLLLINIYLLIQGSRISMLEEKVKSMNSELASELKYIQTALYILQQQEKKEPKQKVVKPSNNDGWEW